MLRCRCVFRGFVFCVLLVDGIRVFSGNAQTIRSHTNQLWADLVPRDIRFVFFVFFSCFVVFVVVVGQDAVVFVSAVVLLAVDGGSAERACECKYTSAPFHPIPGWAHLGQVFA